MNEITEERESVWYELSTLFLDTEVTETDFANIASSLAGTSFSVDEIISIMENEVAPVLHGNLLLVAGQWGCFDREAQVVEPIRARLMRLTDPRNNGWPPFALMRRKFHMMIVKEDWEKVLTQLRVRRMAL